LRRWEGSAAAEAAAQAANAAADPDTLRAMWDGKAAPVVDVLGAAFFRTLLEGAELQDGTLYVRTATKADYVRSRLLSKIEQALGVSDLLIETADAAVAEPTRSRGPIAIAVGQIANVATSFQ
jgi:hypothetical protein